MLFGQEHLSLWYQPAAAERWRQAGKHSHTPAQTKSWYDLLAPPVPVKYLKTQQIPRLLLLQLML